MNQVHGGSQGGSSQSSSEGGSQGDKQQSSESGENKSITVTEMKSNSILQIDTEDIDWENIKRKIENVNTSWAIMMIDLRTQNVSNDYIIQFSNLLNTSIISIKNEDKNASLNNLTNLYSYIPKFLTAISAKSHIQNLETIKYYIFMAYSAASQDDWNTVNTNISNAESNYLYLLNTSEIAENKLNKVYSLLKDTQNSITAEDKELFLLKYKKLMENLNTL